MTKLLTANAIWRFRRTRPRARHGTIAGELGTVRSAKVLVAEANDMVEGLSGEDAAKVPLGPGGVFVDVREKKELEKTGMTQGAVHVPPRLPRIPGLASPTQAGTPRRSRAYYKQGFLAIGIRGTAAMRQ